MGNIVWLGAYPKSGNTWVRAFIANLIADRGGPLPLADLASYCDDEALPERYTALAGRPSSELDIEQLCALRAQVHARIAGAGPGTHFVKTHNFAGSLDAYPLITMSVTAGAIYVVRNPLDVALSMSHHFEIDVDTAIERLASNQAATGNDSLFVSQVLTSWSNHVASWADKAGPRWLVLRYEDLLAKPNKAFAKIAQLIGLDRDRARLARAIRFSGFSQLARAEREQGFAEAVRPGVRFFRSGRANQWREGLSREQIARIVDAHRPQMQRFGYVPPGH